MAFISPEDGYLALLNIFDTDTADGEARLLGAMTDIIDNADYPGWVSSTLHQGVDRLGTANWVQFRSLGEVEERYGATQFKHKTVPLFDELATKVTLVRGEVVQSHLHPSLGGTIEMSPDRDDYTVLIVLEVDPKDQAALVDELTKPDEWVTTVPGYRSHTILRGIDGKSVVNYAQWESKDLYDAFHTMPEELRPASVQEVRRNARALVKSRFANTYSVVHSRSAPALDSPVGGR